MKNILLITTVYRIGEKIYPIIPELSKEYNIDVLHMYQMSPDTVLPKNGDYRELFKSKYKVYIKNEYFGPEFTKDADRDANRTIRFLNKFEKELKKNDYSIALWDNNIPTKGGTISEFYQLLSKYNIKVIGSPHGNREYKGYKLSKRIGASYDYSFVFGEKERRKLSKIRKKTLHSVEEIHNRFIPAGIPSNDILKDYKKTGKYILVITNFTEPQSNNSITSKFDALTKNVFMELRILDLSESYGCPIVIKEKPRAFYHENKFRDSLKKYNQIKFLSYCEDDNELMADAKIVIGSPSTFMFKPIQLGIPTVLLRGYGMTGNFDDYPGLIKPSYENILQSIRFQLRNGRFDDFIKRTISGGLDFKSTELYVNFIKELI